MSSARLESKQRNFVKKVFSLSNYSEVLSGSQTVHPLEDLSYR